MASVVADAVTQGEEGEDPWLTNLEREFFERERGFTEDPEDLRTILLRRLAIKFDLPVEFVDRFIPLLMQQFVYDYSRAATIRKCFELADVNFLDLIPKEERQKIEKKQLGLGKDPFRIRREK